MSAYRASVSHTELRIVITRNTGVIHKQLYPIRLLLLDLTGQPDTLVLLRNITRQGMQTSRPCIIPLHRLFQDLFSATSDVDLRAVRDESLAYHQSDASSSAGNNAGDVRDIEQACSLQVMVLGFGCASSVRFVL